MIFVLLTQIHTYDKNHAALLGPTWQDKEEAEELQCQRDFMISMEATNPRIYGEEICEVKGQFDALDVEKCRSAVVRARAEKLYVGEEGRNPK